MTIPPHSLDPGLCRARQRRVCEQLAAISVERAVLVSPENVQYLTGFRPHRLMHAAVCLEVDGHCTLAAPNSRPDHAAADRVVTFEAQWLSTLRQQQLDAALDRLADSAGRRAARTGVEFSVGALHLLRAFDITGVAADRVVDVEPILWRLRRRKDADELAMIRRAVECTEAMYARAREIIAPGVSELWVYSELHAAAIRAAGEPLTALGNDFQCNSPGGPPRDRPAQEGELFILDLGPAYRGYYADNCRTFSVSGSASDEQWRAWVAITGVLEFVERTVRPGVSCRELFQQAQSMLDEGRPGAFTHHLGHGFGLYPHEAPHLNPHWDDVFEEGDVFTAEPGLYAAELRAGIRLEQNYLVTPHGVERLTHFPLEL